MKIVKSESDKKITGVCGGLAQHFSIDPGIVRVGFIISAFVFTPVVALVTYGVLSFVLPKEYDY